ncbi:MAG: hypothetical protein ACOVN9_13185 [Inhella sp.]
MPLAQVYRVRDQVLCALQQGGQGRALLAGDQPRHGELTAHAVPAYAEVDNALELMQTKRSQNLSRQVAVDGAGLALVFLVHH